MPDDEMTHPPLAEVRDHLKVQWYRSALEPELFRALSQRSDWKGWQQAGGHFALFLMTGGLTIWFWTAEIWPAFAAALFAHGTVGSFSRGT